MKFRLAQTSFCLAMLVAASLINISCKTLSAGDEFTPLFNGKDLSGWTGDTNLWSVKDGAIVGNSIGKEVKRNTFLSTEKAYSDFTLKVKVRLLNGNSGVQFRSDLHPDHVVKGYQADVAESVYSGMLYEEGKRGIMQYWKDLSKEQQAEIFAAAKPLGEWNEYEITCKGHHITMILNGKTVLDFDDPEGAEKGVVALQLHVNKGGMEVQFKDIAIKELK